MRKEQKPEGAFVEVFQPQDQIEVALIESLLIEEGIQHYFDNEYFKAIVPLSGIGAFSTRLFVEAEKADQCRTMLQSLKEDHQPSIVPEDDLQDDDTAEDSLDGHELNAEVDGDETVKHVIPRIEGSPAQVVFEIILALIIGTLGSYFYILYNYLWPAADWEGGYTSPVYFSLSMIYYSIPVIAMVMYITWRNKEWKAAGMTNTKLMKESFIAGIIVLLYFLVVLPLYSMIVTSFQLEATRDWIPRAENYTQAILLMIGIGIAAFAEEILYRGFLLPRFEKILRSPFLSVLLTAIIFSGSHIYQGMTGVLGAFMVGILFGVAFVVFRRIWPLVIAHCVVNMTYL